MGCGKSFTGKMLAKQLQRSFIDLDEHIIEKAQMSINQIFAEFGERYFRELERTVLQATQSLQDTIIATGGGAPCFFDNMDWMNQHGQTIFLNATPELLCKRLQKQRAHRPLLRHLSDEALQTFIEEKLGKRMPYYTKAHITLHLMGDDLSIVSKIIALL